MKLLDFLVQLLLFALILFRQHIEVVLCNASGRPVLVQFKKDALQRKRAVKGKTASPKEFTDWLYQQSNVIENLTKYS